MVYVDRIQASGADEEECAYSFDTSPWISLAVMVYYLYIVFATLTHLKIFGFGHGRCGSRLVSSADVEEGGCI